jgi:hypothetical protein
MSTEIGITRIEIFVAQDKIGDSVVIAKVWFGVYGQENAAAFNLFDILLKFIYQLKILIDVIGRPPRGLREYLKNTVGAKGYLAFQVFKVFNGQAGARPDNETALPLMYSLELFQFIAEGIILIVLSERKKVFFLTHLIKVLIIIATCPP